MVTNMWPGASLTSVDLRMYQNGRVASAPDDSDDELSDTSLDSSENSSDEDEVILPERQYNISLKPRKRVTFQTDDNLVEIFEIPARGDQPELEACEIEVTSVVKPKEFILQEVPQSELRISGQAANFVGNKTGTENKSDQQVDIERPKQDRLEVQRVPVKHDRTEKPANNRTHVNNNINKNISNNNNHADAWGTYTVTHAIAPGPNPPRVTQPKPKILQPTQSKPKTSTPSPSVSPDSASTSPPVQTKSTTPARRNIRAKSAGKIRKKISKAPKDCKTNPSVKPSGSDISDGDQKLIAMFLERNCKDGTDANPEISTVKVQKPKTPKTKGCKRSTINAKNREKEMINKEMKGEGQKRIYRTPFNNISSLHRKGTRSLYRRPNTTDASDSKNNTNASKVKSASKNSLSIDSGGLNSGPRVKVVANGGGRLLSSLNGHKNGVRNNNVEKESKDENGLKNNTNGVDKSDPSEKQGNKSSFIFPEENKFHFPLMGQPKETTSQLVRLDTNMLALYKKKLYAWHMANGTAGESRVQTPCISPMYETMKHSYS